MVEETLAEVQVPAAQLEEGFGAVVSSIVIKGPSGNTISSYSDPYLTRQSARFNADPPQIGGLSHELLALSCGVGLHCRDYEHPPNQGEGKTGSQLGPLL